jgi:hypothetical protein
MLRTRNASVVQSRSKATAYKISEVTPALKDAVQV